MDAKRQNKLLKLAIGRLQSEVERKDSETQLLINENQSPGKFFLTENAN